MYWRWRRVIQLARLGDGARAHSKFVRGSLRSDCDQLESAITGDWCADSPQACVDDFFAGCALHELGESLVEIIDEEGVFDGFDKNTSPLRATPSKESAESTCDKRGAAGDASASLHHESDLGQSGANKHRSRTFSGANALGNEYPSTGSAFTALPHPTNADILFAATATGGVWRTLNATNANPTWTALVENQPSLSIADLSFDPSDATFNTVYATTGTVTNFGGASSRGVGIYKITNATQANPTVAILGGTTFLDVNLDQIVPTKLAGGSVLLLATDSGDNADKRGIFRSTDSGATWTQITNGIPKSKVTDLLADPTNDNRFFAAVRGSGVYVTSDGGVSWAQVAGNSQITDVAQTADGNLRLALHSSNNSVVLYVGVATSVPGDARIKRVFRSTNAGTDWTEMSTPGLNGNRFSGGGRNFAFAADRSTRMSSFWVETMVTRSCVEMPAKPVRRSGSRLCAPAPTIRRRTTMCTTSTSTPTTT